MVEHALRILQVNTADVGGGAETIAGNLLRAYRRRGISSALAVGYKHGEDPAVVLIPNEEGRGAWFRFWSTVRSRLDSAGGRRSTARLRQLCLALAEPGRALDALRGVEPFRFPGTRRLLELAGPRPDILHCHNLHRAYFDLRELPALSRQVPTLLTLHDAWLLSGHCAHSLHCERWKTGCGRCPDLTLYPPLWRDATAGNWRRKRAIFARSRLYVATPSRWLMDKVTQSLLASSIIEARVIPNGVDLSVYHPGVRSVARIALGLPEDASVLLFAANGIRPNAWKDYCTLRTAVGIVAEMLSDRSVLFLALGEDGPAERIGRAEVRFIPYQTNPIAVARYYQAADTYVHAAKADTFPNTVLEALACGLPVVATAVGGIPEQINGLAMPGLAALAGDLNRWGRDKATGVLVPAADPHSLAVAVAGILADRPLRAALAANAVADARARFDLERQVDDYLAWYQEMLGCHQDQLCACSS